MDVSYITPGRPIEKLTNLSRLEHSPYLLVVDDNIAIMQSLLMIMEMEDYSSLGFSRSTEVLPFLEQLSPSQLPGVMLIDLMMPDLSGYELIATLATRPEYAPIRIIAMSADYHVSYTRDVPGADDFLRKPFEITTLLEKVVPFMSFPFPSQNQQSALRG